MPRLHHRHCWLFGISLLAAGPTFAHAGQPPAATAPAPPAGTVVLERHALHDPGTNNMQSHTILAPKGWEVQGSAFWAGANLFNIHPSQDVKVTGPGGVQIHIAPSIGAVDYVPSPEAMQYGARRPAEGGADNGYLVLHFPSGLEEWRSTFLRKFLPQTYPDARDISVEQVVVVPEFTQIIQQQLLPAKQQAEQLNQQNMQFGLAMQSHVDGAMLAVSSTYSIGQQKWEQLNVFGITYWMNDSQSGRQTHWSIEPNVMFRAPVGQLEANLPLLLTIGNSLMPTQQWAKMKMDHIAAMNRIAAQGAADRSAIIADTHREVSRIINDGWEQRQASLDRTHRRTINAIRGVDDFVHPDGETQVQLPHNYQHVFTNGSQYILTNDPNYDPNRDQSVNNLNWDRMRRSQE